MLKCIEKELEARDVTDFLETELSGSSLFAIVGKHLTLSHGKVTAVIPGMGELQRICDFSHAIVPVRPDAGVISGGLRIQLVDNCVGTLIDDIACALASDDRLSCLGELPSSRPGDADLEELKGLRQFGADLYFQITAADGKAALVENIKAAATPWRMMLAVVRNWIEPSSEESWPSLNRKVDALYVGAYDGEGFVRWKPPPSGD